MTRKFAEVFGDFLNRKTKVFGDCDLKKCDLDLEKRSLNIEVASKNYIKKDVINSKLLMKSL